MKPFLSTYLSGPISGLSYKDAIGWTDYAKEELAKDNIIGYKPLRGKKHLEKFNNLPAVVKTHNPSSTAKSIFGRDRYDVLSCDCILVNLLDSKRVSIGTMFEVAWGNFLMKPIVLVMEDEGNVHEHSFLHEAITYRTNNLDHGIQLVKNILLADD